MGTVVIDTDVSGVDDGDALHVEMLVGAGSKVAAWHVRVVRNAARCKQCRRRRSRYDARGN